MAAAALAAIVWVGAAASGVAAHVNRTVGPYTILVVLVEEPVYADNHAGFQFWVRRNEVPILGLEGSIKAVASGHGEQLDLKVPPIDGTGFYVLDHTTDGATFDPQGGGAWTLVLSGAIDGTSVDATFPVTFPSYPRVGVADPGAAARAAVPQAPPAASLPALLIVVGVAGVVLAGIAVLALVGRRRRRGARPGRMDVPI
ncbi:MAG: hypothetical protein QOI92_2587 [Chloroflexota bacterium]|nr:hypothetical protein [Chloroflexota bacterium]